MTSRAAPASPLSVPGQRTIIQGEYATSGSEDAVFSTLLGSCVAVCLHDHVLKVGGMNHFLLPDRADAGGDEVSFGLHAMELLVNDLMKRGSARSSLTAKVFGGAHMIEGLSDVGPRNAAFARTFLKSEGIKLIGESLGGNRGRRIRFWPYSGRAQQMLLGASETLKLNLPAKVQVAPKPSSDDIELF